MAELKLTTGLARRRKLSIFARSLALFDELRAAACDLFIERAYETTGELPRPQSQGLHF